MSSSFNKDPAAVLDYSWDWGPWLAEVSDTIGGATVTVTDGLAAVGSPVVGDTVVTQRVSGGAVGAACKMVCQITTVSGLVDERTIYLMIIDR